MRPLIRMHPSAGNSDSAQQLKHGALPGAVAANDANDLSAPDLERHATKRPEILGPLRMQLLSESGKRRSKCALDYVSKVFVRIM